jgi:acyl-CoA synthetase (AMP-forming)/AMP-acid ligase II
MRVVDDNGNEEPHGETGEIVIRGHNVMKGYWRRPEATDAAIRDGWFHTGDLGRVDQDGYFSIVGRSTVKPATARLMGDWEPDVRGFPCVTGWTPRSAGGAARW